MCSELNSVAAFVQQVVARLLGLQLQLGVPTTTPEGEGHHCQGKSHRQAYKEGNHQTVYKDGDGPVDLKGEERQRIKMVN